MTAVGQVPARVRDSQVRRALVHRPRPCGEGVGNGQDCGRYPAVLFPCGRRCSAHTPARTLGLPEPGRTAYGVGMRADWLGWLEQKRQERAA